MCAICVLWAAPVRPRRPAISTTSLALGLAGFSLLLSNLQHLTSVLSLPASNLPYILPSRLSDEDSRRERSEGSLRFVFNTLRTLPFSVWFKSFVSHSYENCRGVPTFFPFWNSANLRTHCVSVLSFFGCLCHRSPLTIRSSPRNSFLCHTSRTLPVTPAFATDPKILSRKSFVCHTYDTPPALHFGSSRVLSTIPCKSLRFHAARMPSFLLCLRLSLPPLAARRHVRHSSA